MNKFDKFNIALILQDIESLYTGNVQNNIASTAGSLAAGIKKDGFDQKDLAKLMLDQSFDQNPQGVMQKIQNNVSLHYDEIEKLFSENKDWKGLMALETILTESPDFETFGNSLMNYVDSVGKKQSGKRANETFMFSSANPSPALFATGGQFETNDNWIDVSVGEKQYKVVLASSEEEKEQGLQNVESLESNEGMLFDYLDQPQRKISFWMKNTTIELDIVFINDKFKVESVQTGVPLSEELITCKPKDGTIVYVLEVSANSGIKIGDDILINSNEQDNSENNEEDKPDLVGASLEILGSDGSVQAVLQGGERIFSIKNTKTLVSMAKRAYESQSDSDYKALGRKIFEYMKIQDERDPEYVDN